jgi:hypothetical protein
MRSLLATLVYCVVFNSAFAQSPPINPVLTELRVADQAARAGSPKDIDWARVSAEDAARRTQVIELIKQGGVRSAGDYCIAALIFQHGDDVEDIRLAYSLATTSRALDPSSKQCKWLSAAAWDRLMMQLKRPQWYGTQFTKSTSGKWELYNVDESAVSDDERTELGVPPIAKSRARAEKLQ